MPRTRALPTADDFPPFRTRLPWVGPDLQSVAHKYLARGVDLAEHPGEEITVEVADGSGDRLRHHLHVPPERFRAGKPTRPTVVLMHGLGGDGDSAYVRLTADPLLAGGFPVVRYNRRGCGVGRDLAAECPWHGDTAGLGETAKHILDRQRKGDVPDGGLAFVGFSQGGNTLVQFLADDLPGLGLVERTVGAATVSTPIDLAEGARGLDGWRNLPYRPYYMGELRDEMLRDSSNVTPDEAEAIQSAWGMWDFTEKFNAPRNDFDSADAYYADGHLGDRLRSMPVPLLMIHSCDDPWVPHGMYESFDFSACPNVVPLFSDGGGHMGFHGADDERPWSAACVRTFLERLAG